MTGRPSASRRRSTIAFWLTPGLLVLLGGVLLLGCARSSGAQPSAVDTAQSPLPSSSSPTRPVPTEVVSPTTRATEVTPVRPGTPRATPSSDQARLIELAKQDLAQREGIPLDQISVISVSAVQWPTSALGCPQPGTMYSQIVTPGYRILLEANGVTYEYHTDRGEHAVYCAKP